MTNRATLQQGAPIATLDRAIQRVLAEIHEGVRHGYFAVTVDCEIVGQERRRLTLRAGKSFQYLISKEECFGTATPASCIDSRDGSDPSDF